jgi:hypothetical protein
VALFDLTAGPGGGGFDPAASIIPDARVPLLTGCVGITAARRW